MNSIKHTCCIQNIQPTKYTASMELYNYPTSYKHMKKMLLDYRPIGKSSSPFPEWELVLVPPGPPGPKSGSLKPPPDPPDPLPPPKMQ